MPSVFFKAVESFSSEDPNYPASNLLKPDNRKWKCRDPGEKQAFVVLKLAEPIQISGIDIGNEHSAHIGVMVARSGPSSPTFTDILLATKFMNPVDSRNSTAPNQVQCFTTSALVSGAASGKWDLVKIICTQPFNSRVKYGLAFVALHTMAGVKKEKSLVPERFQPKVREEATTSGKTSVGLNLGRFKLREESPESDDGREHSSMFARWKDKQLTNSQPTGISVSALMRDSVKAKVPQKPITSPVAVTKKRPKPQNFEESDDEGKRGKRGSDKVIKDRNHESLLYDVEDDKPSHKLHESITERRARFPETEAKVEATTKADSSSKKSKLHDVASSKFKEFLNLTGQSMNPEPKQTEEKKIANSGHQFTRSHNEQTHGDSRKTPSKSSNAAPLPIETVPVSSAKHMPTPSTSAARPGISLQSPKPLIVDTDSDKEIWKNVQYKPFGKLLENVVLVISGIQNPDRANIRNQALALGAKYKPDWDAGCTHLICAYKNTPKYNQVQGKGKIIKKDWIEKCYSTRKRLSWRKFALDTEEANKSDSEDEIVDAANKPTMVEQPSGKPVEQYETMMLHELSDSDDRVALNPYELTTEEEGDHAKENEADNLDMFKGKRFFLHQELGAVDIIKLERYIRTFKGTISKDMSAVDYVIARSKHTLPASSRAELVKPLWIYECNDMECLIPIHRYRI